MVRNVLREDVVALGWSWCGAYTFLGVLILLSPVLDPDLPQRIQSGRGSALQFVAAIIVLVAVASALFKEPNWPVIFATSVATVFGIVGTWLVFADQNAYWALLILLFTFVPFYATGMYLMLTALFRSVWFTFRR